MQVITWGCSGAHFGGKIGERRTERGVRGTVGRCVVSLGMIIEPPQTMHASITLTLTGRMPDPE